MNNNFNEIMENECISPRREPDKFSSSENNDLFSHIMNEDKESEIGISEKNTLNFNTLMKSPLKQKNPKKSSDFDINDHVNEILKKSNSNVDGIQNRENQNEIKCSKVTSYEIAELLSDEYDFGISEEQLYYYRGYEGYWKMLRCNDSYRYLRKLIPTGYECFVNKNVLSEVYEWLITNSKPIDSFENKDNKYFVNFRDCAVNWKTGEIVTERENLYFRYTLNFDYNSLPSKTGAYKTFLYDVFGDNEKILREFRKFMGLSISDIRTLKYSFFLYGPSNIGKSVILNILKKIIGDDWCSSISFSQMGSEFAITELLGKRINISGEVSGASNKRLDIFKSLTGNDDVTMCYKGKDHFHIRNRSLLVFACNVFPNINSPQEMEAFLSRIIIFPFSNVKPRSEWIDDLDELLLDDVGEIIKDAIEGLKELEEDNFQFKEIKAMKRCKMEFQGMYDSFTLFADEYISRDMDSVVSSQDIGNAYRSFCMDEGYIAVLDNVWGPMLMQKFICSKTTISVQEITGTKRLRGYKGIKMTYYDESDLE